MTISQASNLVPDESILGYRVSPQSLFVVCYRFPFFPILIFNETIFNFIIIKRNTLSEDELPVSSHERAVGDHRLTSTSRDIPLLTPIIARTSDSEGKIAQTY